MTAPEWIHIDADTGLPTNCEKCAAHWWRDRPRFTSPFAYFTRYHLRGH